MPGTAPATPLASAPGGFRQNSCCGACIAVAAAVLTACGAASSTVATPTAQSRPPDVERESFAVADAPDPPLLGVGEWLDPRLRSVQFTGGGAELQDPIVPLDGAVVLTFDWLEDDDVRDFRYDVIHCDRDWRPDRLPTMDYLATFSEGDIRDFRLSVTAKVPYVSYRLQLPNQDVAWTVSGNYLLRLYDDDTGELVARLRFCVHEGLLFPDPLVRRPVQAQLDRTHQEFFASVNVREGRIENPRRSLTLSVTQNGDWRYTIPNLPVRSVRGEDVLWDYPGKIVFPGHREWRNLDLRTLRSDGGQVAEVAEEETGITAYLLPDRYRVDEADEVRIDVNGKFVLDDFDNRLGGRSEYATVLFSLRSERDESIEPLYLYGALNGYALSEANRGVYNDLTRSYVFRALLRQGFYEYAYVSLADAPRFPSWSEVEGNTFAAENHYNFLVYYRPYGARFDRLVGYRFEQVNPTGATAR